MRIVPSWHRYYLDICHAAAARSKDPRTQVGALIIGPNQEIRATGYNGFPRGLKESDERWERPRKHDFVIHAELNAIVNAARAGTSTEGCTMYVDLLPCPECCKAIIQAGIVQVIIPGPNLRAYTDSSWLTDEIRERVYALLNEGNVDLGIIQE